jgi:tRNA (guanine-N7-)-methyltransferase
MNKAPGHRRTFYGRIRGKALRPNQRRLLEELLPRLSVPGVARAGMPGRTPVDTATLFGPERPVWLEIGFGGGEHLVDQALSHPEVGLIGCEPFINGLAMALARIEAAGPGNLRLHAGDARDLLDLLPTASLARVFLLYPDPWPKTRHRARRFMNSENLAALARVMVAGAELRLATDIPDYVDHALAALAVSRAFAVQGGPEDWTRPWPGWPGTRYEAKALREGRVPQYLTILRTAAAPVDDARPIA